MRLIGFLSLLLTACSATPSPCVPITGKYRRVMVAQSGNCFAALDQVVSLDPEAGCDDQSSADGCTQDNEVTCHLAGGVLLVQFGTIVWSDGGRLGRGTVTLTLQEPARSCSGVYSISYERI